MTIHRKHKALVSLGMKYPALSKGDSMGVDTPDAMGFETKEALRKLNHAVGNVDVYVMVKLKFNNLDELYQALKAEQIDAVALAIYNIEEKNQGIIVADQTGIGKGRIAASMIRYAVKNGKKPIFFTEKPNLFSDLYRDLIDIDSGYIRPFIVNGRDNRSEIKDLNGKILYQALEEKEQKAILAKNSIPSEFDVTLLTYSQISDSKETAKKSFIRRLSNDNIIILDEAHNASGLSSTGAFIIECLELCKGVTFLSATFAKRPDNMVLYAKKTCLAEANMDSGSLVDAFVKGGVALQEVVASQLAGEGQLIRRERLYDGVEINYINLTENEKRDVKIADSLTEVVRDIIEFQREYVVGTIEELGKSIAVVQSTAKVSKGTKDSGIDVIPVFSRVFNIVNQMLFALKADDVAERAIMRLKQGKKPIIAFASTMGAFLEQMDDEDGEPVKSGSVINADFNTVLVRALMKSTQYSVKDAMGKSKSEYLDLSYLDTEGRNRYFEILDKINKLNTGLSISPIDYIKQKIENEGYKVGEVTGRKYEVILQSSKLIKKRSLGERADLRPLSSSFKGTVLNRSKEPTNVLFRQFNDNELDVLMINQSGSTGASAQAKATAKVPTNQVKQRVMIVLQPELDINIEVQKRGRIMRTGQIMLPIYDYLISCIPAETRLMMMLQKKLKSLDANTSANQKNSKALLQSVDFLNKYGDRLIFQYLFERDELNKMIDDPLKIYDSDDKKNIENAASQVSGRIAVLPVEMQKRFYNEFIPLYQDYIELLKEEDKYDLEVETMPLRAKTIISTVEEVGNGGTSPFGGNVYLNSCEVDTLKKPYSTKEIAEEIKNALGGNTPIKQSEELVSLTLSSIEDERIKARLKATSKAELKIKNVKNNKSYKSIESEDKKILFIEDFNKTTNEDLAERLKRIDSEANSERTLLTDLMRFFKVGMIIKIPIGYANEFMLGTFLGFKFKRNTDNPYKASNIGMRFGLAYSRRQMTLQSLTGENIQRVLAIKGASNYMAPNYNYVTDLLPKWEEAIRAKITNRTQRDILAGNLIKVASRGKLIDYTTIDGNVKKGVLLPENQGKGSITPTKSLSIVVPVQYCAKAINALPANGTQFIQLNKGVSIGRNYQSELVIKCPKTEKEFITNKDLLEIVERGEFIVNKDGGKAIIKQEKLSKLLSILAVTFKLKASLTIDKYNLVANELPRQTENFDKLPRVIFDPSKVVMTYPKPKVQVETKTNVVSDRAKLVLRYKYKALAQKQELELLK